jgi:hypothetical protein
MTDIDKRGRMDEVIACNISELTSLNIPDEFTTEEYLRLKRLESLVESFLKENSLTWENFEVLLSSSIVEIIDDDDEPREGDLLGWRSGEHEGVPHMYHSGCEEEGFDNHFIIQRNGKPCIKKSELDSD